MDSCTINLYEFVIPKNIFLIFLLLLIFSWGLMTLRNHTLEKEQCLNHCIEFSVLHFCSLQEGQWRLVQVAKWRVNQSDALICSVRLFVHDYFAIFIIRGWKCWGRAVFQQNVRIVLNVAPEFENRKFC